jgi:hypothetical protein
MRTRAKVSVAVTARLYDRATSPLFPRIRSRYGF